MMIERGLFSLRRMSLILARSGPQVVSAFAPLSGAERTSNAPAPRDPIYELGEKLGIVVSHVVHRPDGRPLAGKNRTAREGMLADAGLGEEFVRHTMRHTAATWRMQAGTGTESVCELSCW
jgi:hypothetical protein